MKRQSPFRRNLRPVNAQLTVEWHDTDAQGNGTTQLEVIELDPRWAAMLGRKVQLHPGGAGGQNISLAGCTDGQGVTEALWHPDRQPHSPQHDR